MINVGAIFVVFIDTVVRLLVELERSVFWPANNYLFFFKIKRLTTKLKFPPHAPPLQVFLVLLRDGEVHGRRHRGGQRHLAPQQRGGGAA